MSAPVKLYKVGDPDPTPDSAKRRCCPAIASPGFWCTWNVGHTHPQHVAGDSQHVVAVWPVTA